MILYHFTLPELLPAIEREGLRANAGSFDNGFTLGGKSVVWLTARDSLVPCDETRKAALRVGVLWGPKCSALAKATVCLRVRIPSSDWRLKQYVPWLRKQRNTGINRDDPFSFGSQEAKSWWIYLGDVPPSAVTVFKHVPETPTYWDLPDIARDAAAGLVPNFDPELESDLLAGRAGPDDYVEEMKKWLAIAS